MPLSWEIPPCLRTFGMTVVFFFLCLPATHAQIAEGDACAAGESGHVVQQVSSAGGSVDLICNGSNWKLWRSIQDDGSVQTQIGNDTGSCTSSKSGRLRYNEGTDTWQYCNNSGTWSSFAAVQWVSPEYISSGNNIECSGDSDSGTLNAYDATPGKYLDVSCFRYHCCAVEMDGSVACWGRNASGEGSPPSIKAIAIATSFESTCAIESDGDINCWGTTSYGKNSPPAIKAKAISGATHHYCAVGTDGKVYCWGDNTSSKASPPSNQLAIQVETGVQSSIALEPDGDLVHWGGNSLGEDGFTNTADWRGFALGDYFACGIDEDGAVSCWGDNDAGESTPPGGQTAWKMSAESDLACALEADGTFICWGDPSTYGDDTDNFTQTEGYFDIYVSVDMMCGLYLK